MAKKTYRPKANVEKLSVTVPSSTGHKVDITSWPYTTEDAMVQRALGAHNDVTDGAEPKKGDS